MKFWDASAIIPLCMDEPHSNMMRDIAREDDFIVVWWGSLVECRSAFARLYRDGMLTFQDEEQARELLAMLAAAWTEIEPSEEVRNIAGRLLLNHPLRAADSLQVAAALVWAEKNPRGHPFVSLDARMREAARKEGFALLPAHLAPRPTALKK